MDKERETLYPQKKDSSSEVLPFPVVGIGASAGGLEALQAFFSALSNNPNAAFVIVQHLSPDFKSMMNELLSKHTEMPIHKIEDGMSIEINNIYLIPPRAYISIFHGKLYLHDYDSDKKLHLPIDFFLRSLAKDQKKNSIAIILSGTGSDGTLGIKEIKENGGLIMAQDNHSAKFNGMPRSSVSTGLVDFILKPAKLANALVDYIKHPFVKQENKIENLLNSNQKQLAKVIGILRDEKGVDFSDYRENTIVRRLEKRISITRFTDINDYVNFLTKNPKEVDTLFNDLLIGVTRFFRDEKVFEQLETLVIPKLFSKKTDRGDIRLWVPACSTGEEAYSLAILLLEYMEKNDIRKDIKIFATDLDRRALEIASTGFYPDNIASDIKPERLAKYLTKNDNGFQVNEALRSIIIFAKHDILQDPPFLKVNLISCRNFLIYLKNEVQQRILATFHYSLNPNGFLFLGNSESLGAIAEDFKVINSKAKIFEKTGGATKNLFHNFNISSKQKKNKDCDQNGLKNISYSTKLKDGKFSTEGLFDSIISDYLPPSIIIDENFQLKHIIHDVSLFIQVGSGQFSNHIFKLLPKDLSVLANSLIRKANDTKTIVIKNIPHPAKEENELAISCKKIKDNKNGRIYYLISFKESEKEEERKDETNHTEKFDLNTQYQERIEDLERDLKHKDESLKTTIEELETSNEELQSSNEELIASNEELQSTNEELQSVNEELYTVNSEHMRKIEELTELNSDFDNLLKNTNIGSLFIDSNFKIRKINSKASDLTDIIQSDIGRPLNHLSIKKLYPDFIANITRVSKSLKPIEKEIGLEDGSWVYMRIVPYRTMENAIEGVIVTFIDISKLKGSQKRVSQLSQRLEKALEVGNMTWWEWDYEKNQVNCGKLKYSLLGYQKDEICNKVECWTSMIHPEDYDEAMEAMRDHLTGKKEIYEATYRIRHKNGTYLHFWDKGQIVERTSDGEPKLLIGIVSKVTEKK